MRKFLLLADLPAFTVCVSDLPCSGASPVLVPVSVSPLVLLVLLVLLVSPLVVLVPGSPVLVSTTPVVDASVVESVVGESVVGGTVVGPALVVGAPLVGASPDVDGSPELSSGSSLVAGPSFGQAARSKVPRHAGPQRW